MAQQLTAAAEAIASVLGSLPQIDRIFPYPKPLAQCQPGQGNMAVMGVSPPSERTGVHYQEVTWDVVIMLRSATSGNEEQVQKELSEVVSLDPSRGIVGVLYRSGAEVEGLRNLGIDPYLDPDGDGINIEYDVVGGNNTVVTLVRFQVLAQLPDDGSGR